MLASTVTQKSGFPGSQPTIFGHTTGGSDRLTALYKRRQEVIAELERSHKLRQKLDDEIELELAHQQRLEAHQVLAAVAAAYVVDDVEQLRARTRNARMSEARHVVFWILHQRCWSAPAIGELMHRDHTTVLHGVRRVESSPELRAIADDLYAGLRPETGVRLVASGGSSPRAAA